MWTPVVGKSFSGDFIWYAWMTSRQHQEEMSSWEWHTLDQPMVIFLDPKWSNIENSIYFNLICIWNPMERSNICKDAIHTMKPMLTVKVVGDF